MFSVFVLVGWIVYLFSPIKALVFSCAEQSNSVSKGTVKENMRERDDRGDSWRAETLSIGQISSYWTMNCCQCKCGHVNIPIF